MEALLTALQFLTALPIRLARMPEAQTVGRSLLWYPWVGLFIGLGLTGLALATTGLDGGVRAALILAAWVLITGALHLDGLADSADAWVGGFGDRQRTLAIMKDPYCGPAGVTALVLVLLLKFTALEALLNQADPWPLLLAPVLGRTVLVLLFLTTPYVRRGGLGSALAEHSPRFGAGLVVILSAALVLLSAPAGGRMLPAAAAVFLLLRRQMQRRLGGTTGDTAGALVELSETAALVAAAL